MNSTDHSRWNDEIAAYMLGALSREETKNLEQHAQGCERCREQILWLAPALQALPESVERIEPRPQLRSRLMSEVRADARREGAAADAQTGKAGGRIADWLRRLGSGPMGLRPVVGFGVALLLVVAVGGYAVFGSAEPTTISAGEAPGVTAELVRDDESATLRLANVGPLPNNRVLQAWVERDGEVEPVPALFAPDRSGRASTTIEDMDGVETVMVTREPAGGSDVPTSKPFVAVPIPADIQ